MTFSRGISSTLKSQLAFILGVQVVEAHDKYLGMPAMVGKSKQQIFSILRERVWKKKSTVGVRGCFQVQLGGVD